MKERPVLCLMGPTASGKTEISLRIAEAFPVDLISVDSALVYRGMDIGTAKPDEDILASTPHALIDIREPEDSYSAGAFVRDATKAIEASIGNGRIPLLVGGTMMYFRALTGGLADLPEADAGVRAAIDEEARAVGWPAMHAKLQSVDERAAARIDPNDAQRIQRALEVFQVSGRALSDWQSVDSAPPAYDFHKLALYAGMRKTLHERIEQRLDVMLANDVLGEVRHLMARPELTAEHASMRSVGYRQFWAHLAGEYDLATARAKALAATRQLAKRQLTWLRSETGLRTFDVLASDVGDDVLEAVEHVVDSPKN